MKFSSETVIQASPDEVFAYVADISRHPEWGTFKMSIEKASEGAVGLGSKYRHTGRQFGATSHDDVTVTVYEPPRRLVLESVSKDGMFRHTYEIEAVPGGTKLTKTFDFVKRSLMMKLFTPTILMLVPGQVKKDLARIKERVETPALAA